METYNTWKTHHMQNHPGENKHPLPKPICFHPNLSMSWKPTCNDPKQEKPSTNITSKIRSADGKSET